MEKEKLYKDIASKDSKYNLFKLVIKPLNHLTYNTILRRVYKNKRCILKLKQDLKHIKNKENKILEFKSKNKLYPESITSIHPDLNELFKDTMRLNTIASSLESFASTQKKPCLTNWKLS